MEFQGELLRLACDVSEFAGLDPGGFKGLQVLRAPALPGCGRKGGLALGAHSTRGKASQAGGRGLAPAAGQTPEVCQEEAAHPLLLEIPYIQGAFFLDH